MDIEKRFIIKYYKESSSLSLLDIEANKEYPLALTTENNLLFSADEAGPVEAAQDWVKAYGYKLRPSK